MKKTSVFLFCALAAVALVFMGCPTEPGDESDGSLPSTLAIGTTYSGVFNATIEDLPYGGGLGFQSGYYTLTGAIAEGDRIQVTFTFGKGADAYQQVSVQSSIYNSYDYIAANDIWYNDGPGEGAVYTAIILSENPDENQGIRFDFKKGNALGVVTEGDKVTVHIKDLLITNIGPVPPPDEASKIDFATVTLGTEYAMYNIYGGEPEVIALPKVVQYGAGTALKVYPNNNAAQEGGYKGNFAKIPFALPDGKTAADYDHITIIIDLIDNVEGGPYDYKNVGVYIGTTKISGSAGTDWSMRGDGGTGATISIPLTDVTSSNTFDLSVGIDADRTDQPYYIRSISFDQL
jgi:hypothetical protein